MNVQKTNDKKIYQCRYCGQIYGSYTGNKPSGQCPSRPKPKVGIAPHIWIRIK